MANIVEVTDATFKQQVEESELPVLLDFSATWCGPCKLLEPTLEEVADEFAGRLQVVRVDVDSNRESAARFGVMSVPTLILFKGGQVQDQLVGNVAKRAIVERVNKLL